MTESETYEVEVGETDPYLVDYWPKMALTFERLWGVRRNQVLVGVGRFTSAALALLLAFTLIWNLALHGDFKLVHFIYIVIALAVAIWFPHAAMAGLAMSYRRKGRSDPVKGRARYTVTPTRLEVEYGDEGEAAYDIVYDDVELITRCGEYFTFFASLDDYILVRARPPMLEYLERVLADTDVELHDVNEVCGFREPVTPTNAYKVWKRKIDPVAR